MNIALICATLLAACGAAAAQAADTRSPALPALAAAGPHPPHVRVGPVACAPDWPANARAARAYGRTTVRLFIDPAGQVRAGTVLSPSGPTPEHHALDEAVVAAFSRCQVDVARDAAGQPVACEAVETWTWSRPDPADTRTGISTGSAVAGRPAGLDIDDLPPDCRPTYPPAAVRQLATGYTTLSFTTDSTGRSVGIEVLHPAGPTPAHQLLDDAARVIGKCPFQPALDEGGAPTAGNVQLTYTWRLD